MTTIVVAIMVAVSSLLGSGSTTSNPQGTQLDHAVFVEG